MPLTPSFNCSQLVSLPNVVTIADNSTGSDVAIASRRIAFQKTDGSYLVPTGNSNSTYVTWPLINISQDNNILDKDYALKVTVDWLDAGGNPLYTKIGLFYFTMYGEQFLYTLTQYEASNPRLISDAGYFQNKLKLRTYIDSAVQAITYGSDIYASQSNLDKATDMRINQNLTF